MESPNMNWPENSYTMEPAFAALFFTCKHIVKLFWADHLSTTVGKIRAISRQFFAQLYMGESFWQYDNFSLCNLRPFALRTFQGLKFQSTPHLIAFWCHRWHAAGNGISGLNWKRPIFDRSNPSHKHEFLHATWAISSKQLKLLLAIKKSDPL